MHLVARDLLQPQSLVRASWYSRLVVCGIGAPNMGLLQSNRNFMRLVFVIGFFVEEEPELDLLDEAKPGPHGEILPEVVPTDQPNNMGPPTR